MKSTMFIEKIDKQKFIRKANAKHNLMKVQIKKKKIK